MTIPFYKYQGTGNDFIMIDDREGLFPVAKEKIAQLCHRRFGIGADGLILLQKDEAYDFRMKYFNADGGEGSMCGNGGRATVRFAHDLGVIGDETRFIAVDGEHEASVTPERIALKMSNVKGLEEHADYSFMNTGSPHVVAFTEDLENYKVYNEGYAIRYSDDWVKRGGTNVNFVEQLGEDQLFVRTYERGVEDETYSCGTGVTACALTAHVKRGVASPVKVKVLGGNLEVSFEQTGADSFENIYLIGPAERVFEGSVEV
ncbi:MULTISPECIES: diaminopimelate epimerase [unclassified Siphonobacter]|uniref:diaminopimelate epimerase n=1 Tax=unclassified Siphonobacter TaxID=2635712 RepID=UPI000CC4A982|nr:MULTISPECIES: diaminopimelate epimerase [unclassified Siphonobacter]MDQ1088662.1 diaminopimelate epimerase [Siphonobacter sp. SORGH_AS_1065]MDR6194809.1 diaminopimelate epimerase [Siphonobacter sp. SORGH_AS_0500]PKK35071.1 diaminopimelate epimerase [Siphonobacter sp. SORGH_AS_0500]